MGTWGVGISANDDFQDVKDMFFYYFYHDKMSVADIVKEIIDTYRKDMPNDEDGNWHNVYFAIAYCEWKCGFLSNEILLKVQDIIESNKDIEHWKELDAWATTLKKRAYELKKFLNKLKSENPKPIKRRYSKPFVFPLKTGDVFACYSKANGYYGCGVVLEVNHPQAKPFEKDDFSVLVAISEYTPKELPAVEQIISSNALDVFWNGGSAYTLPKKGFVVIGNVADRIDKDYLEYFGKFKMDGRIYGVHSLRPNFDELISGNKSKRVFDKFSIPNKPIYFFFDKNNLQKTEDILQ